MEKRKFEVYLLSNTHWDREWYMPHETYLVRLVSLLDRLLDIMDREPEYVFITDGQFSMVEDYLTVRPEKREKVSSLVKEGRLKVGPWFTQPLETLVSGEAMIRNLHYGIRGSENLGGAMRFSYEVDQFGHASQTPQILRGFGIDGALAWRGMPVGAKSAFEWVSPDGSSVIMLYTNGGYGEATDLPSVREDFRETIDGTEIPRAGLDRRVEQLVHLREEYAEVDCVMWLNGIDHSFAQPDIREVIDLINHTYPELTVRQTTPEAYLTAVREAYCRQNFPMQKVEGELMYTAEQIIESTHSCHPRQKQRHYRAARYLERCMEPTTAMAWMTGAQDRSWMQERAWKYVLENHAHDTLGCTSVDAVYEEAMARYSCALSLAEQASEDARRDVMACFTAFPSLFAFNTSSWPMNGVHAFSVDLPEGFGKEDFALEDADGTRYPVELLSVKKIRDVRFHPRTGHPTRVEALQVRALAEFPEIPAFGWRRLTIVPGGTQRPMRNRTMHYLSPEPGVMENEWIRIRINANGSFDLTDKVRNVTYPSQYTWEDTGDCANVYLHIPPLSGKTVYSTGGNARVALLYDHALGCSYEVCLTLAVPEGNGEDGFRSVHEADIDIRLVLTLLRGAHGVEVETTVTNRAREHRLRALFPTYLTDTGVSRGGQPFDVPERRIHEPAVTPGVREQPYPTHPMQDICDITGKTHGLTVAAEGIYEYECLDDASRALALTMVRSNNCIDACFGTSGQYDLKEAENLAVMTFRTALFPHDGDWRSVYGDAMHFLNPAVITPGRAPEESVMKDYIRPELRLPDVGAMVALTGEGLMITSVKKAYDRNSLMVRVLNQGTSTADGCLSLTFPGVEMTEAWETNLDEERTEKLEVSEKGVAFTLRAAGLKTVEFIL